MLPFHGPIFIVGMPRSGTKLLRNLMNQHSRIRIPAFETELLPYLSARCEHYGDLTDRATFNRFYMEMTKLPFFAYQKSKNELVSESDWYQHCKTYDAAGVFEGLIREHLGVRPDSDVIWGDKSPSYIGHVPLIKSLYPAARIVHIVRDVRDHCLSMKNAWGKHMYRAAERWSEGVVSASDAGRRLEAKEFLELKYEELLEDPEAVLKRVCEFVEVGFESSMLEASAPTEASGDTKGHKRVVTENREKYRSRLSVKDRAAIEALAFEGMRRFNYSIELAQTGKGSSPIRRQWWRLLDAVNLVRSRLSSAGLVSSIAFHFRHFRQTRSRGQTLGR